jgi:hypothetical protein
VTMETLLILGPFLVPGLVYVAAWGIAAVWG